VSVRVRAQPSERGMGKPGFPTPPPAGGCGRAQPSERGMGTPGFPTPPPAGGCGRAQPSQEAPYVHPVDVRRDRIDGWGDTRAWERGRSALVASPRARRPCSQAQGEHVRRRGRGRPADRTVATYGMLRRQDRVWLRACCQQHACCDMSGSRCGSAIRDGTRCRWDSAGGACVPVADAGCGSSRTRRSEQDWGRQAPRVTALMSGTRRRQAR